MTVPTLPASTTESSLHSRFLESRFKNVIVLNNFVAVFAAQSGTFFVSSVLWHSFWGIIRFIRRVLLPDIIHIQLFSLAFDNRATGSRS